MLNITFFDIFSFFYKKAGERQLPGGVQVDKKDLHSINVMQVSEKSNHSAADSTGGRSSFENASKRAAVSAAVSPGEPM